MDIEAISRGGAEGDGELRYAPRVSCWEKGREGGGSCTMTCIYHEELYVE